MAVVNNLRWILLKNKNLLQIIQFHISSHASHISPQSCLNRLICTSNHSTAFNSSVSNSLSLSMIKGSVIKFDGHHFLYKHDSSRNFSSFNGSSEEIKKDRFTINNLCRDRQECVELFRKFVSECNRSEWSSDNWQKIGDQLSDQFNGSWEVLCMHTLMLDNNIELGRSLMKYLEARSRPVGSIITTFFIGLLGRTCSGNLKQEVELKKYYDVLVSEFEVFDAASIEVLVEALSHTKYYRECVQLLEMCQLTSPPGLSLLRNTLYGALRYHDHELCLHALEYFDSSLEPSQLIQAATILIDTAISCENTHGLHLLMEFMQKHSVYLPQPVLEEVMDSFQRHEPGQWKGSFGYANYKSGKCTVCGHQLPGIHIQDDQFKAIQSAFLEQVIVSDNIFFKTSPEEVQNFIKFVDRFGPFDIVIDGMNALHSLTPGKPNREMLARVVHYFCDQNKRVLVLGSKVLQSFIKVMTTFEPKPVVYMTSTTRADDAFFLYAALHSGKDTLIVSADKLRDHKFKLQPDLRPVFHKWLMSIQIYSFVNPKTKIINPKRHVFDLGPHKDDHGWHMPVNDVDRKRPFGRQAVLCLRHGPENFPPEKSKYSKSQKSRSQNFNTNKEWFEL